MKVAICNALAAVAMTVTTPASACPGQSAEKFLFWSNLPDVLPGEVAVEVDLRDALVDKPKREKDGDRLLGVVRVLAGTFHEATIAVRDYSTTCTRTVAGKPGASIVIERLIVVGRFETSIDGTPALIPRYMSFEESKRFGTGNKR